MQSAQQHSMTESFVHYCTTPENREVWLQLRARSKENGDVWQLTTLNTSFSCDHLQSQENEVFRVVSYKTSPSEWAPELSTHVRLNFLHDKGGVERCSLVLSVQWCCKHLLNSRGRAESTLGEKGKLQPEPEPGTFQSKAQAQVLDHFTTRLARIIELDSIFGNRDQQCRQPTSAEIIRHYSLFSFCLLCYFTSKNERLSPKITFTWQG